MVHGLRRWLCAFSFCLFALIDGSLSSIELDILFVGGRVLDPETNRDEILNVGISKGQIVYIDATMPNITSTTNTNVRIIDIKGLILCPGFIDIHAHHQTYEGNTFQARDGVTTSLELEVGAYPVQKWYTERAAEGSLLNYGVSVGHIPIRLHQSGLFGIQPFITTMTLPSGTWNNKQFNDSELTEMLRHFSRGVNQGSIGIGLGIEYVKDGATAREIYEIFKLAKKHKTVIFVHVRESNLINSFQEMLANSASLNTAVHIMHIGSSARDHLETVMEMIFHAADNGVPVTTEVYPYAAASTLLKSKVFAPGFQQRMGVTYHDLQYVATGERLTEQSFQRYRNNEGGLVVIYSMKERFVTKAVAHPEIIIASDGIPFVDRKYGHPRAAGTFTRVLSRYVRQLKVLDLMSAIRKMSYLPAKLLEQIADGFKRKGRVQIGMDADLTVFDEQRVIDMGTYTRGAMMSEGVIYVTVGGVLVVDEQSIVKDVRPGKPMRSNLFRNEEKRKHTDTNTNTDNRMSDEL